MRRSSGRVALSAGILCIATVLYYRGWLAEKRAEPPIALAPFEIPAGYWRRADGGGESDPVTLVTFFRSLCTRWYRYEGARGERVRLSLSLLSDVAPVVHCYLWNRHKMEDAGEVRITTGAARPRGINARLIRLEESGRFICLYWYMGMEEVSSNFFVQEAHGIARRIARPGTCFLMVRVVTPVRDGGERKAAETASRFIRDAFPSLQAYAAPFTDAAGRPGARTADGGPPRRQAGDAPRAGPRRHRQTGP